MAMFNNQMVCFFSEQKPIGLSKSESAKRARRARRNPCQDKQWIDPRDDSRWLQPGIRWHQKMWVLWVLLICLVVQGFHFLFPLFVSICFSP